MVEIIFLMLVLKLPILYLGVVVWWAIRAEPRPPEPAALPAVVAGDRPLSPRRLGPRRPHRGGPHARGGRERAGRLPLR